MMIWQKISAISLYSNFFYTHLQSPQYDRHVKMVGSATSFHVISQRPENDKTAQIQWHDSPPTPKWPITADK